MVQSMVDLERMFNANFGYPWTFLNDVPFTDEFKRKTRAATKAEIAYGWVIPSLSSALQLRYLLQILMLTSHGQNLYLLLNGLYLTILTRHIS